MPQIYNIYCDESSIENMENQYMVIGALFMRRELRDELKSKIKALKAKYNYRGEIKWNKTTKTLLPLYRDVVDLFLSYNPDDLEFHCIKADRQKIDYEIYHSNDKEEGFYKFYYQLLKNKFINGNTYYIFLDYKPTKLKNRVYVLEYYLKYRVAKYLKAIIKSVQAQQSSQSELIQLADLFAGAVNFDNNQIAPQSESKKVFIEYLAAKLSKKNLKYCSLPSEKKFNIFCIEPGKNKCKCD